MNLKDAARSDLKSIKKLYKTAFPAFERKPFRLIARKSAKGAADMLVIEDNGFVGFAVCLPYRDIVMINYFAIDPGIQGKGYGGRALKLICEKYGGKRMVLEIETPDERAANNAQRLRRKQFYTKNGWADSGIRVSIFGIDMTLMTYGCGITFDEYHTLYRNVFGNFIARRVKLILVPI